MRLLSYKRLCPNSMLDITPKIININYAQSTFTNNETITLLYFSLCSINLYKEKNYYLLKYFSKTSITLFIFPHLSNSTHKTI